MRFARSTIPEQKWGTTRSLVNIRWLQRIHWGIWANQNGEPYFIAIDCILIHFPEGKVQSKLPRGFWRKVVSVRKMARGLVVLFSLLSVGLFCHSNSEEVTKCIDGPYHKDKPSPEGADYVECHSWREKSCCTANFTAELQRNRVEVLYNFSWNHCKNLSQECEKFIKNQECFWSCEPNLIKWHVGEGVLKMVPICAKYCDEWFDACKSDYTCVQDWLRDFNYTNSIYSCPTNSPCRTFQEFYKNGEGLCNTMWAQSFYYEKSDNCMVMEFAPGKNPNDVVTASAPRFSTFIHPVLMFALLKIF